MAAFRKAIELKPDLAPLYNNLGTALSDQNKPVEAEAVFRKAIARKWDFVGAHVNLGNALLAPQKRGEAEAAYKNAIELQPDCALAYSNLGNALSAQQRPGEAEAAYRRAIALKPDLAEAYNNLGNALRDQKKLAEAVAAYKKAIERKPDLVDAHYNLGNALRDQKRLAEAVAALRRADQLLPNHPAIRNSLRLTERWIGLDEQLSAVLANRKKARTAQEQIELGLFCGAYKQQYATAARFFSDAFSAEPKLAPDLNRNHRYNAACYAALAATGQGEDAARLPSRVPLTLRRQALRWLRADLEAYSDLARRDDSRLRQVIQQRLEHWQKDADLAGVRDKEALATLPDHERAAWRQFWADVAVLRNKVKGKH